MITTITKVATILSGESLSDEIEINGREVVAIHMPAAWTAAVLTFASGNTSGSLGPVKLDDGTEVQLTVAADDYVILDHLVACGFGRYLQVRSGTSGAAVNQGDDRVITIVTRQMV